ncbi:MAG: bifunctional glutamine synthetase adenylyltransferase/deadenyltransferase [Halothiobacillus sp. 14-56-357]|jgi:glutamate-ammonia-ligase adenylyltransferase|uniref:bifunctional [glutamate--ammonia ligase]-adenylyl-L-tyrosine phosphorylase/[glutamate--ammonia-ligase] adenylyltransferase n=1 Tax=Halothiobacillus sp. 15-55-196 TaxID=1970382 RepID=UPI000BD9FAF0|nr:bifunctional [glutamate--ammonia ligase]-adenylyl-L-tyrosine phosphorylase/[glutamate--ammonia-ligase] adenylyltransferase [Halothiobacillus sp. 15-55-196]OZB36838.1 MAG: bifunctional glutamine synthetase adenylyltransferase/deadenyltransferase [Halothiobacillus sp. 15-55-196]OZB56998.1 MAG: bifunctional glutamine synthetase adenylyltransferase/deadenyltransferase [Halothiobacillus sp. 14-56-357]OZB79561.1 MAG: bifunctional glutamine synthetase adenylyltransferase/deadenyltransferase [Halothi
MINLIEPEKRLHIESDARDAGASVKQLAQLRVLLEVSPFVAENITKQPDMWPFLLEQVNHANSPTDLAERIELQLSGCPIEDLDQRLRHIRRVEMLRIAWRDVAGLASTAETLRDLSDLADQCVQQALTAHERVLVARHGVPRSAEGVQQHLVVLGMGKLGGYELNYSSDIDLIFLFEEEGETDGPKPIANSEFFIKLGQRVIRSLNEVTKDGFVFRVDMRLRPHGDEGALALSFDAAELYYTTLGREWERYALIKARVIAGDQAAGARLLALLKPFVYRKYLDFGAFAQLRDMKKAIEREMSRRGMHDNIKLGPGGIREIEFIGQLYQLLRGGREPKLQSRSILTTLEALRGLKELPSTIIDELLAGYDFLRRAENRLQMMHDRQTQTLPLDDLDQARLALAMGYSSWGEFMAALDQHRQRIHRYFGEILQTRRDDTVNELPMQQIWLNNLTPQVAEELLCNQGFDDPESILDTLLVWKRDLRPLVSDTVRQRLDLLMPSVLQEVAANGASAETLRAVLALVDAVLSRSVYLALLIEQPAALKHLVQLCSASPWIAELLRQQPILLDELVDANNLYSQPDVQALSQEISGFLSRFPDDEERQFDELRRFRQLATLRVAAADVMGILPVMRVSDQLTWIAEVVLEKVLQLAYQQMVARHGEPRAVDAQGVAYTPGFAIIAYGKLGGIELGYGSDLDVVFLHDSTDTSAMTTGSKPIDNQLFFARLAQKIIHILSIRTPSGVLYEVDTRLRPDGAGGLLVSSLQGFEQYQKQHAWLWETQALCRARFITGQSQIAERFATIRRDVLCATRDLATLKAAVLDMRQKMRAEHGQTGAGETFHLKRGIGGITDIEFMVQFLLLRHAHEHPPIVAHTDNIRQLRALAEAGLLDGALSERLVSAYQRLRNTSHRRTLNKQSLEVPCADFAEERAVVLAAWQQIFEL